MNEADAQTTTGGDDSAAAGAQAGAIGESGPPTEPLDLTAIFKARLGADERDAYI